MKTLKLIFLSLVLGFSIPCHAQQVQGSSQLSLRWFSTTSADKQWRELPPPIMKPGNAAADNAFRVDPQTRYQTVDGFGGCFNELGWNALQTLATEQQEEVLKSLFDGSGCGFAVCRMGMGANDFASNWYSFDETPGDYEMADFSIDRDRQALIPFIKAAMKHQPKLAVWGVPWSPPSWMKTTNSYKAGNMKQDPKTLAAYALYFSKYVQAYRKEGINLYAVHPQNEPRYNNNIYPQCAWSGQEINTFMRDYLVPRLKKDQVDVQVWLGTIANNEMKAYTDPVLSDPVTNPMISGVGYQYEGQSILGATHEKYPDKKLMQTETECFDGLNAWRQGMETFNRISGDMNNFANGYMFWNLILNETACSTWGWRQNSLITIVTKEQKVVYNPEFYAMKHFSHGVHPGAVRIAAKGPVKNLVAFQNPSGEIVMVFSNDKNVKADAEIQIGGSSAKIEIPAESMNTICVYEKTGQITN